ncbi:MAG: hypothetical protein MJ100_08755 [Ruminococcus sp.]|nr:hypothetical protein [Ruminococcus sp.]
MLNKLLDKIESKCRRFAVDDLMIYVIITMGVIYAFDYVLSFNPNTAVSLSSYLDFDRALIMKGQVWRILTFLFIPDFDNPIWVAFELYFMWMLGTGLQKAWGAFKFNVYFIVGALGCMAAGMVLGYATNTYHYLSLFLAFAILYPDYEIMLFFILPVKMKWLGIIEGASLLLTFIFTGISGKVFIGLSLINLILFFGKEMYDRIYYWIRRKNFNKNNK